MYPHPGATLGPYEFISLIGAGGMGQVWLARDRRLHRAAAIKLLPTEFSEDPDRVERFDREARAASTLNHPNVCTIYAFGDTPNGQQYIAMEYIEGETLRKRLNPRLPSIAAALDVTTQVTSALAAAHSANIIHRDIKPENLMVRPDGIVKVLDFGLAKLPPRVTADSLSFAETTTREASAADIREGHSAPGAVLGTVPYMSPEQIRGAAVGAGSDLWSLGVILYESLAGRRPFVGKDRNEIIAGILTGEAPPLAQFQRVPRALERIVSKALHKEWAERYRSAGDLMLDLRNVDPSQAIPESPPWYRPWAKNDVGNIVDLYKVGGHGAHVANTDQGQFPLADRSARHPRDRFYSVTFDAEVTSGLPWAAIDEIAVVVHSVRALPLYRLAMTLGLQRPHEYYIEIDKPPEAASARFVTTSPVKSRNGLVRLKTGEPEPFAVDITARTPGLYQFSVFLTARYKDHTRELILIDKTSCLFVGRPQP